MDVFDCSIRRIFFWSLILFMVPAGILLLAGRDAWARGVILGGAASLLNLLVLAFDIRRSARSPRAVRMTASFGSHGLRMVTVAAVLIYAASDEGISLLASIPPLFCVQAVIFFGVLTGRLEGRERSPGRND